MQHAESADQARVEGLAIIFQPGSPPGAAVSTPVSLLGTVRRHNLDLGTPGPRSSPRPSKAPLFGTLSIGSVPSTVHQDLPSPGGFICMRERKAEEMQILALRNLDCVFQAPLPSLWLFFKISLVTELMNTDTTSGSIM